MFWSENNEDDDEPAMIVEMDEKDGDDDEHDDYANEKNGGCGGMIMGITDDDDGDVKYVASCFGTMNVNDDQRRGVVADRSISPNTQRRLRMEEQRRRRREERERSSVVAVVKLNGEEEDEKEIGEASTVAADAYVDTTARRRRRRLQRAGREFRGYGIRRIRSAPAKGGGIGSPSCNDDGTSTRAEDGGRPTWTTPFREHQEKDDRIISNMEQSLSMEERSNIGGDRSMTWMRRSSSGRDATTMPTRVVHVASGNAKLSPPSSDPTPPPPPLTNGPLAFEATNTTMIERDDWKKTVIDRHFPPLEICVVRSVELVGLNSAARFFDVFFADDAPYSMRDFQRKRGDVDVVYGPWEDCPVHERGTCMPVERDNADVGECETALYSVKEGGVGKRVVLQLF